MTRWSCFLWLGILLLGQPAAAQQRQVFSDIPTNILYTVEEYRPANFPVGMVFAPDGRLFYTEKTTGNVRVILPDGTRVIDPVLTLPVDALQERGMFGIALDPTFATTGLMYVAHTRPGTVRDFPANDLVRFRLEGHTGVEPEVLLSVPITTGQLLHNGGNMHFDRDGYLYFSTGDNGDPASGQNLDVPQAKIHRFAVTADGLAPAPGNPFGPESSVFAYGLRNAFDFTFDPYSGHLFAAEVGPSCDDEINLVQAGYNYGWQENYTCVGTEPITGLPHPYGVPLLSFRDVIAPTGIVVYDGAAFPAWQGNLFFCDWVYGDLRRAVLDETRTQIVNVYTIDLDARGCRLDIVVGPDGGLYYGTVGEFGGAIMRLLPFE
ncbi:MAG: PQQ-dependent sugar dehydrogenase [Anaerolineae bacterium]|nr:PQQ-dependent sugar dehydrogenase [Anaerolineae bacterium]